MLSWGRVLAGEKKKMMACVLKWELLRFSSKKVRLFKR